MPGNIKGITVEFRANTTPIDKAINQMRREARGLDKELGYINKSLKFNPTNVKLWSQKQTVLKDAVKQTDNRLKELKNTQKQLDEKKVDRNSAEYRELEREIAKCENQLRGYKRELSKLPSARIRAMAEGFKIAGQKMTAVGKTLTTSVTLPLTVAGGAAVKSFAEVDKIMVLVNSTMGNTEDQANLLSAAMKEAAANSTYGMNDAAQAALNFARAGLNAEEAAAALAPAMNLAAGEGGDLDTVSGGLVATINGFHGSFDDAAKYADVFANACNNSALDVNSLSNAMSVAAPIFSAAGYSVEDAALYMGVMANNGISADKAANSLKTGLARLVSPAKAGAEEMEKLGISVTNADGSMKDSVTIQKELNKAFSNLSESEQISAASAIFGKNQMSAWLALINTAPSDVDALSESIMKEGTAAEMAADQMSGFGGSLELLKSNFDVAKVSLGEALAPTIEKVVGWIQKGIEWFNSLDKETQSMIATILMVVAAAGPLLVVLGSIFGAIGNIMTVLPMLAGPVGIAIAVIGALVAAGIWLYKNWDLVKEKASELKEWVVTKFNELKTGVLNFFGQLKEGAIGLWNGLKEGIKAIAIEVTVWSLKKFLAFRDGIRNTFQAIKDFALSIWTGVKDAIVTPIKKAVDIVRSAIDKLKSLINGAKLSLPKFKLPHFKIDGGELPWGIGGLGKKPSINVEWYKTGKIFTKPTIAGLAEAGPEGIVPIDILWNKLDAIADSKAAGGPTYIFNITVNGGSAADEMRIARTVKKVIIEEVLSKRLAFGG